MKYTAHTLGYRVLYECNRVSVVLPASLVATVLLSQHQRGIYREELIAKVFWLKDEIMRRRGRVC
jgi:glycerol-3-phosphate O-acyltransferase